jgi:hypothetical protein
VLAVAALLLAAGYQLRALVHGARPNVPVSAYDIYSYFYPVMLYARDRLLHHGGRGLLWNPFQNAGQPFMGTGVTGILYPPSLVFLLLEPDRALHALLFINMAIGALGAYVLGRELGVTRIAAVAGGLAFAFSHAAIDLISFTPIVSGPYAWLPWALALCERLLRAPGARAAIGLGVVLTLALLPGHPQGLVYTYQVIALRVLWEMVVRRSWLGVRTLAALGAALAVPPLLGAVHLLPALEVMRLSVRGGDLEWAEMSGGAVLDWSRLRRAFMFRRELFNPLQVVPFVLAAVALANRRRWAAVFFYVVVAAAALDLSLGPNGHLFALAQELPLARLFRGPDRYLWIAHFAVAVLAALGVDALLAPRPTGGPRVLRWTTVPLAAAAVLAVYLFALKGLYRPEWIGAAAVLVAALGALLVPRFAWAVGLLVLGALVAELLVLRPPPLRTLLLDGRELYAREAVFTDLRGRMSAQERAYVIPAHARFALQHKTGSLFGVPTLFDYESLPSRRWAEYFTMLRTTSHMRGLNDVYYPIAGWLPSTASRPLLDLAAGRWLVAAEKTDTTAGLAGTPLVPVATRDGVRVYQNTTALPRARWVGALQVIADDRVALERLARGRLDPRRVAVVASPPPSGFVGGDVTAAGRVIFARDDPEQVVLEVDAPARGFVVLADQDFPGWQATVNGEPAAIVRADYVFRLVEVPAGRSTVDFRYRPRPLFAGALVSAATLVVLVLILVRSRASAQVALPHGERAPARVAGDRR